MTAALFELDPPALEVVDLDAVLDVFVPGVAMWQGSKNPMPNGGMQEGGNQKTKTEPAGRLTRWRKAVSRVARDQWADRAPLDEPVAVRYDFARARGGTPLWRVWAATRPDCDKLQRAINDSLAQPSKPPGPRMKEWVGASVLRDDSRVVLPVAFKRYAAPGEEPGVRIRVYPLGALERAKVTVDVAFLASTGGGP